MEKNNIYSQISERTQGDIYIGVVGPVRTGKSTFIKRFMDLLVIPNIENVYARERANDELPQSGTGRTIMTTEPKFIPNSAVTISVDDNVRFKVRLVDCVGYLVKGAIGYVEENAPRMVSTPWFDYQIPFGEAAELGTKKVINDHSTIGLVVTTDGSVTELSRDEYLEAEERVVNELKAINKPFIVILNSKYPQGEEAIRIKGELEAKYATPVFAVNCQEMRIDDINAIMERVLLEFPISEIGISMPRWIENLENNHWLKVSIISGIKDSFKNAHKIRQIKSCVDSLSSCENIKRAYIGDISLGEGRVSLEIGVQDGLFYRVLSEATGMAIEGEHKLIGLMQDLARIKREYDKVEFALHEVKTKGYGIVSPGIEELSLERPEIIKHGGRFGVKLRASAPSIHMIRADIETEIAPLVGSEKQSEELVDYLIKEFEGEPERIWESNIFGKSLHELISEGLYNKLYRMPEDAQLKIQDTLQRIINEGSNGLICIII